MILENFSWNTNLIPFCVVIESIPLNKLMAIKGNISRYS